MDDIYEYLKLHLLRPIQDIEKLRIRAGDEWYDAIDLIGRSLKAGGRQTLFARYIRSPYEPPSRAAHIYDRLGHIAVNPHDDENSAALRASYVFVQDDGIDEMTPNFSPRSLKHFIDAAIQSSRLQRHFLKSPDVVNRVGGILVTPRISILHGDRGIGKTFFLNYLLSEHNDYLDRSNTIWVRINLASEFSAKPDLRHWIHAQTAKIVLRYYDPSSEFYTEKFPPIHAMPALKDQLPLLPAFDDEYRRSLNDSFAQLPKRFQRRSQSNEPVSPNAMPAPIARIVFDEAIEAGYSIIAVLDGYDRLEASNDQQEKLENLAQQVTSIGKSYETEGFSLIVVMRTGTYHYLNAAAIDPFHSSLGDSYRIASVPLERIIDRRIDFIVDEVQKLAVRPNYDWDLTDWPAHAAEFRAFLWRSERNGRAVPMLERFFGTNKRAQMQVSQLSYYEFGNRNNRQPYQLVESMVKSGLRFPPKQYNYREQKGTWARTTDEGRLFDSRFLPVIFTAPHLTQSSRSQGLPELSEVLLGTRILQLLSAHRQMPKQSGTKVDSLTLSELLELMSSLFGYKKNVARLMCFEFQDYELTSLSGRDFEVPLYDQAFYVELMPKGDILLNEIIYDLAYLNLSAMRIPLPHSSFSDRSAPFFVASAYDSFEHDDLGSWVAAKVLNSLSLARLIRFIDDEQVKRFDAALPRLSSARLVRIAEQARVLGMYEVGKRTTDEVLVGYSKIFSEGTTGFRFSMQEIELIRRKIDDYMRVW